MKNVLVCLFVFAWTVVIGQNQQSAVIVVGRVLNKEDSILVREKFFNGLRAKAVNNMSESASYFREVLELDPSNAPACYELARIYHAQHDEDTAEGYARSAVTVNSENKWYWLLLADIYKKARNYDQLVLVFNDLIHLDPQNDDYYFDKANALFLSNKLDDADAVYKEIEVRFGSSDQLISSRQRLYQQQGSPEKAAEEIEKLLSSNPDNLRYYLSLSDLYIKSGDFDSALKVLLKAREKSPSSPFVRLALAQVYEKLGQTGQAKIELKTAFENPDLKLDAKIGVVLSLFQSFKNQEVRATATELGQALVEMYPREPKAFSVYGDVLYQDQKFSKAREAYKKALELNPGVYLIWEQILRIGVTIGDFGTVIKDGEEALRQFPNRPVLYFYTAVGYSQNQKFLKAINYLNNAANLETEDTAFHSQIYASLGDAYNALKKYPESDLAYEKALVLNPQNTYVMNNYAYYLALRGDNLIKAEQVSLRSNELQPDNASFQDTYAWVLFKLKKYDEARSWIEKALKNNPASGVLMEHYGDILYHLDYIEQAVEQWKLARKKGQMSKELERKINEKKFFE